MEETLTGSTILPKELWEQLAEVYFPDKIYTSGSEIYYVVMKMKPSIDKSL